MPVETGQMLSHYRLVEKIGEGGMGVVWKAVDTTLRRDVAIKFLPDAVADDPERLARFEREARLLASLNHPNIAAIYGLEKADSMRFLVLELVPGETLAERIFRGPLAIEETLPICRQIAEALEAAHEKGTIHRDLKPANIKVTADGKAKVLDFGLAKALEVEAAVADPSRSPTITSSQTRAGVILGTAAYMSPEQARGKPVDKRTDIWSFGCVLYECLTGKLAFRGETVSDTLAAILKTDPDWSALPAETPTRIQELLRRCLQKDPHNRLHDIADARIEIGEVLSEAAATSSAAPVVIEPPRPVRSRRLALAMAVTVIAVLVVIAGYFVRSRFGAPRAPSSGKVMLAVLPLENLSADPENEYFSDGMTEEIINKLSRIQELRVASRTSVARFKGTQKDIKEIGKELGVRYVLEGSVRKAGNQVRITAQLIDSSTGFHIWAEDFTGELKDVFAVQEETALKIAEALDVRLSPQERQVVQRRYTENPKAYDAYLRGQALLQDWNEPEKLDAARRHHEHALQLDPNYALALAGLASVEAQYYRNIEPSEVRLERGEQLARRALALDPRLPRAHAAMGELYAVRYKYALAAEKFREATRLEPEKGWNWDLLSWALAYQQPPDPHGAEEAAQEAIRLQPRYPSAYYHLGRALLLQGRHPDAIAAFEHALELNPDLGACHLGLGQVFLAQGDHDRALQELRKGGAEIPTVLVQVGSVFAAQGEKGKALAELEKALSAGYRDFAYLESSPYLASLRSDPRFQQLMRRYRN